VNTIKGALLMSSANVAFCAMACLVKYVSFLNVYTTTLFRFMIGMGIIGILAMSGKISLSFVNKPGLFVRGLLGGISIAISFFSITKLGLIKAGIIINLYPIFATLLSRFMLNERLSPAKVIAIIGAFAGVCVIMLEKGRGGLDTGVGFYEALAVFGSFVGGLTVVSVKQLQKTDSTPAIFFAQCLVGLWIVLVPASIKPASISLSVSMLLISIGVLATVGQLLSTYSMLYMSVATGAAMILVTPLFNAAAGILLFHEQLTVHTIIGSVIILLSTGFSLWKRD